MATIVEVDDRSQYRCDHWRDFASKVREYLAAKNLPPAMLGFCIPGDSSRDSDSKYLSLLFGAEKSKIPGSIDGREGGQCAQALVGKNYLRIWGLPDCPGEQELENTKRLLDRLLPQVVEKDPEKLARLVAEVEEAKRKRSQEAWIAACVKRFEKTLENTRQSIAQAAAATEKAQQEVVRQIRIRDGQERKLEQMEAARPQVVEKYAAEFEKLAELPHVMRVAMEGNKISVFTDRIYCDHDGRRYDIGDFRIEVYMDGSNGGVRMFNLTRQVSAHSSGMHAPHVFRDGNPCLGNLKEAIPQYIGEYEYSVVVMLCVQYLQSVNVNDDAGKYISQWPVVERPVEGAKQ